LAFACRQKSITALNVRELVAEDQRQVASCIRTVLEHALLCAAAVLPGSFEQPLHFVLNAAFYQPPCSREASLHDARDE
jgi:hypothetical protein